MSIRHLGDNCPVTGEPIPEGRTWTDHSKEGSFNSCRSCDPDGYVSIGERLHQLNEERRKGGGEGMTEDEFINLPKDCRVRLIGGLEGTFGHEGDELFILKDPGDTDGALTTPYRFASFRESLAHVYADDRIMRYRQKIGDLSMLEPDFIDGELAVTNSI